MLSKGVIAQHRSGSGSCVLRWDEQDCNKINPGFSRLCCRGSEREGGKREPEQEHTMSHPRDIARVAVSRAANKANHELRPVRYLRGGVRTQNDKPELFTSHSVARNEPEDRTKSSSKRARNQETHQRCQRKSWQHPEVFPGGPPPQY